MDLDTIEVSNLNRQFLFRRRHVGRSKAEVARESVLQFAGAGVQIAAHQGNVKDAAFNVEYFKGFDIVLNGLDNLEARMHVNRLCLAAEVPLVESGTAGYLGQCTVHVKGKTECFECTEKPKPKKFPVCTLRNTPDKPIHCVVWAKEMLLARLFGPREASTDIDDLDDPEAFFRKAGEAPMAFAQRVFKHVFEDDIRKVLSMEELWERRERPRPLVMGDILGEGAAEPTALPVAGARVSASALLGFTAKDSQNARTLEETVRIFLESVRLFVETRGDEVGSVEFDKDDDLAMDLVFAASNLRSHCYRIPPQTLFDAKGMAGNIVHAIATTNAIVSGLIVIQAVRILSNKKAGCDLARATHTTFINERPSNRKLLMPVANEPPNPKCYVCSKVTLELKLDVGEATLGFLVKDVLKKKLGFNLPDITVNADLLYEEGDGLEPDEVATYERRLALRLQDLPGGGIRDNTMIDVEDFSQGDLKCQILVVHCGDLDEEAHPEGFALAGKLEAGAGKENEKRPAEGAAEEAGPSKKAKVAEESDSDECLIVG